MRLFILSSLVVSGGCSDGEGTGKTGDTGGATTDTVPTTDTVTTDTVTTGGACGDVSHWDLTVMGSVEGPSGSGASGASVRLEERAYQFQPVVYGSTYTDTYGNFSLAVTQIVSVEGCWGTLLDYNVVAELGVLADEAPVNQQLYNGITSGSLLADLTAFPLQLQ